MSQLYDIYQSDTFHLSRSVVIKYDLVSEAINRELQFKGYIVSPDFPTSYKYYLNLSGRYHISDHDALQRMYGSQHIMVDIATNTGYAQTPFTLELFHGATANKSLLNEYQLGSSFYKRLIDKYPEFESLIRGILNPVDIDLAISSPDGTILSIAYQHLNRREDGNSFYRVPRSLRNTKTSTLIEPQEHNIITELQNWVTKTLQRWVVAGYSLTDDLYVPFVVGIVSAMLPAKLMNIRWENVHTSYAHTFHIKEYLNSHGVLGKYVQFIPLKEILYLYRNVRYLELNMGKTHTFNELVSNMLTPTRVPLAGYFFKHDISDLGDDTGNLLPESRMMREHLNFKSLGAGSDRRGIRELLDRQIPLARENYRHIDLVEQETIDKIRWSGDDELIVKVLESELTDIADPIPVTLVSQLFWFWAYSSSRNWYTGSIFVSNPVTGDRIALTPLSAFILMIYCINVSGRNKHLEFIPNDIVTSHWITKSSDPQFLPEEGNYETKPTFSEMRKQSERSHLSDNALKQIMGDFEGDYISNDPDNFFNMVKEHHDHLSSQFLDLCKVEDGMGHGYAEHAWFHMFWHDIPIRLAQGDVKYDEWLPRLGVDFGNFAQADYNDLAIELVSACTGLNDDANINRVELQRAMIEILKHFGSYTTHYLHSANQGTITNSHGKYVRVLNVQVDGNASLEEGVYIGLDMFNDRVDAVLGCGIGMTPLDVVSVGLGDIVNRIPVELDFIATNGEVYFHNTMPMHQVGVLSGRLVYETTPDIKVPVPPANEVSYEYNQYVSSFYLNYTNPETQITVSGITGSINDNPVLHDVLYSGTVNSVGGVISTTTSTTTVDSLVDNITISTVDAMSGSIEHITNTTELENSDRIWTSVSGISGGFVVPVITQPSDTTTAVVLSASGAVVDATTVSEVIEEISASITDVSAVVVDQPNLGDVVENTNVTIDARVYDEPNLLDECTGQITSIIGGIRDDRGVVIVDSVTSDTVTTTGNVGEPLDFIGGTSSGRSVVYQIVGSVNDEPSYVLKDTRPLVSSVVGITGYSSDIEINTPVISDVVSDLVSISVELTDLSFIAIEDSISIETTLIDGEILDSHVGNLSPAVSLTTSTVTGIVYDSVNHNYSNDTKLEITTITGSVSDTVSTYGASNQSTVVSMGGVVLDESYAFIHANTQMGIITVDTNVYDHVSMSYEYKPININLVTITGAITDED